MKISALLLIFLPFMALAETNLFYIDSERAKNIASEYIKNKKPIVFSKGIRLNEISHEYEDNADLTSSQILKVTFLYSESINTGRIDNLTVSVVLNKNGEIQGLTTGRKSIFSSKNKIDKSKYIESCINRKEYHSEMLEVSEYCKYSSEPCPIGLDKNEKMYFVCTERSLGSCFDNRKWISVSKHFGLQPNLEVVRRSVRLGNTKECALIEKP